MKRFIVGLLILGAVVAVVATIMKRRSGSDVGWDEFAQDSFAKASDAAKKTAGSITDAATERTKAASDAVTKATEAATDAANKAADQLTGAVEKTKRAAS